MCMPAKVQNLNEVSHLLFDLDHTLWDCSANSVASLHKIFKDNNFASLFGSFEEFNNNFQRINDELWADLPNGQMTVSFVRRERFVRTLKLAGVDNDDLFDKIDHDYMVLMSHASKSMPHAKDVLSQLSQKYEIDIVTNGVADVQESKLRSCGLDSFVKRLFISDKVGAMKPQREYFDHVMKELGCGVEACLMIGDNPETDIKGAQDFGIQAIWYNSRQMDAQVDAIEIKDLKELLHLLL